jgi:hypothetical protein
LLSFKDAEFVILATDNLNAEVRVGQRCLWLGIPLIQAAVHGDTLVSQVRFFGNDNQSACPACGYSRAEWIALNRQTQYACDGDTRHREAADISGPPTMSVSFLCSLAADLCLGQVLRHTLDLGSAVADTILEFCMYTHQTAISPLDQNPNCPCDHTPCTRAATRRKIAELSLAEIAGMAGYDDRKDLMGVSFKLGNMQYGAKGFCKCRPCRPLARFFASGTDLEHCRICGDKIMPHPFFTFHQVPAAQVADQLDCRLELLGARSEKWAMLRGTRQSLLLIST